MYTVVIDGETHEIDKLTKGHYELPTITIGKMEFYIAENSTIAGEKAREYWEELVAWRPVRVCLAQSNQRMGGQLI